MYDLKKIIGNPICVPPNDHGETRTETVLTEGDVTEVLVIDYETG
jgi:hypothetical protein